MGPPSTERQRVAGGERARTAKERVPVPRPRAPGPFGQAGPAGPEPGKRRLSQGRRPEGGGAHPRTKVRRGDGG
eukprot:6409705-Heterocapsa_arctica.AAC.1